MEIGTTLTVYTRSAWRSWLSQHHADEREIWFIFFKKHSGVKGVPYNHAVEEALCYGWIDSIVKSVDADRYAQRFTPRKPKSVLSEMNKERIRRLIAARKMRKAGLDAIAPHLASVGARTAPKAFVFPKDILAAIRKDPAAWKHYQRFPLSYRRIRVGWIDGARERPEVFQQRLAFFIKKCSANERFGMVQ